MSRDNARRRRFARGLVRLHPPAWQRRYAAEVMTLVGDLPPTVTTVLDLARSLLREWGAAWWRTASARPTGLPGVGQLVSLVTLSFVALLAGSLVVSAVDAVVKTGLYWLIVGDITGKFLARWAGLVSVPDPIGALGGLSYFGLYWIGPAVPAVFVFRLTRVGRRWPIVARLFTAALFSAFPFWAFSWVSWTSALIAGWVFASALFPRRRIRAEARTSRARSEGARPSAQRGSEPDRWITRRLRRRILKTQPA